MGEDDFDPPGSDAPPGDDLLQLVMLADDRAFALALVQELAGLGGTVDGREEELVAALRRRFDEASGLEPPPGQRR